MLVAAALHVLCCTCRALTVANAELKDSRAQQQLHQHLSDENRRLRVSVTELKAMVEQTK